MPADLHGWPIGGDHHAAIERAAGAIIDASLIVGAADLVLHDRERPLEPRRHQWRFGDPAHFGEVAGDAIGNGGLVKLDHGDRVAQF